LKFCHRFHSDEKLKHDIETPEVINNDEVIKSRTGNYSIINEEFKRPKADLSNENSKTKDTLITYGEDNQQKVYSAAENHNNDSIFKVPQVPPPKNKKLSNEKKTQIQIRKMDYQLKLRK